MSLLSYYIRKTFAKSDRKRDSGLTAPPEVERFTDIRYADADALQVLDVYRPKDQTGPLPVIVSVHGGAWVYGDKELYSFYCMDLAKRGFAVVNFSYRLAPEAKFPAQLEDTCAVFRWVPENAAAYGLDAERLFAVGDSAGAHLLCLYCVLCLDPDYAARFSFRAPEGGLPKALALNCGVYRAAGAKGMSRKLFADLMPRKGTAEELKTIDPLSLIGKGFPPSFVMTACRDFLQNDALLLHQRLDELGVPNEFHLYDDPGHTLGHVFHLNMRSGDAASCNDEECRFLRRYC